MTKLKAHRPALVVGLFMASVHAIWALMVLLMPKALQSFLNWIFVLHFLQPIWTLTAFNFVNALLLVVVTFIFGYCGTWLFMWIWSKIKVKK